MYLNHQVDENSLTLEEWQLKELEAGIKEADAGIFASIDEVKRILTKWLNIQSLKLNK